MKHDMFHISLALIYLAMRPILKPVVTEVERGVSVSRGRSSIVVRLTSLFCLPGEYGIWKPKTSLPRASQHTCIVLTQECFTFLWKLTFILSMNQ